MSVLLELGSAAWLKTNRLIGHAFCHAKACTRVGGTVPTSKNVTLVKLSRLLAIGDPWTALLRDARPAE